MSLQRREPDQLAQVDQQLAGRAWLDDHATCRVVRWNGDQFLYWRTKLPQELEINQAQPGDWIFMRSSDGRRMAITDDQYIRGNENDVTAWQLHGLLETAAAAALTEREEYERQLTRVDHLEAQYKLACKESGALASAEIINGFGSLRRRIEANAKAARERGKMAYMNNIYAGRNALDAPERPELPAPSTKALPE